MGVLQAVVSELFFQPILYNGHYLIEAENPFTRKMYDQIQHRFYCLHMTSDVYAYVA